MGGNPDQARQLVTRYIQRDKIDFFTGPIGSNVVLAVGPALLAAKVPYLSNNPGPSLYAGARCNPYWFATSYQNDAFHEAAIGRAHVCTPVTNAQLVCRIMLPKKTYTTSINFLPHIHN